MAKAEILRTRRRALARGAAVVFSIALGLLAPEPATAGDFQGSVYAGRWGLEKEGSASELGFEIQRSTKFPGFDLVGGVAATDDEAYWAYAGASWSWQPNAGWRLRPGFAISVFEEGDGKDLGGAIEFRSSLEATYQLPSQIRIGLLVYHLSNAGIYDLNPGSNSLVFVVGFP